MLCLHLVLVALYMRFTISIQQTNRVDDNKYNIYSINQVKMHSIIL